jgi:hypothetical protein
MLSSHCSGSTRAIGWCASFGLGLILASCTDDKAEMEADASPDVAAVADASEGTKSDTGPLFQDATITNKDAGQVFHDATVVTRDAVVIGDDVKADVAPSPDAGLLTDASLQPDTGGLDVGAVVDTSPLIDTHAPIDGAMSPETRPACEMPRYSKSCIEVALFQCGFTAKCEDGVISISWHEHACNGDSWVTNYDCTYTCPKGCQHDYVSWTSPGTKLVEETCNP